MPVQPPKGWGAEQWARLRQSCLHMAEKIYKHQPLTFDELGGREMCLGYGAPPPPSATGAIPPGETVLPPPRSTGPSPQSMPTPVPEISPQSNETHEARLPLC